MIILFFLICDCELKFTHFFFFDYNSTVLFFDYYYVEHRLNLEHKRFNLDKYQIV